MALTLEVLAALAALVVGRFELSNTQSYFSMDLTSNTTGANILIEGRSGGTNGTVVASTNVTLTVNSTDAATVGGYWHTGILSGASFDTVTFSRSGSETFAIDNIVIGTSSTFGSLQLNSVDVTENQIISYSDISSGNLKFTPDAGTTTLSQNIFNYTVNDGTVDSTATFTMTETVDPIIFDLNDDGIKLISSNGDLFDFNMSPNDSLRPVAWVGAEDGILAFDLNSNGKIDNITELFSEHFGGQSWESGLDSLTSLDSDSNGMINALDENFENILIWQDADSNSNSSIDELYSLPEIGIEAINLNAKQSGENEWYEGFGNLLSNGWFEKSDGNIGSFVEMGLLVDDPDDHNNNFPPHDYNSLYVGTEIVTDSSELNPTISEINISDF